MINTATIHQFDQLLFAHSHFHETNVIGKWFFRLICNWLTDFSILNHWTLRWTILSGSCWLWLARMIRSSRLAWFVFNHFLVAWTRWMPTHSMSSQMFLWYVHTTNATFDARMLELSYIFIHCGTCKHLSAELNMDFLCSMDILHTNKKKNKRKTKKEWQITKLKIRTKSRDFFLKLKSNKMFIKCYFTPNWKCRI